MFDYDKIMKPNTVVHCDTKEKAINLIRWADSMGLKWCDGEKYTLTCNEWDIRKTQTCYGIYKGYFSPKEYYEIKGYTILKYEEVLIKL